MEYAILLASVRLQFCPAFRTFVRDHPRNWDLSTNTITFSYNTLCQESKSMAPFDLILSKTPIAWHLDIPNEKPGLTARETKKRWLDRLRDNLDSVYEQMSLLQANYKANYDEVILNRRIPRLTCNNRARRIPGEYRARKIGDSSLSGFRRKTGRRIQHRLDTTEYIFTDVINHSLKEDGYK